MYFRRITVAAALASAVVACGGASLGSRATGFAQVDAVFTDSVSAGIARMILTVSAGEGPAFTPITVPLQPSGPAWTVYVTGIPAGPGREFEVTALDAGGAALYQGSGKADVLAGATATVTIHLGGSSPPYGNTVPVLDSVSSSAKTILPGGTVRVRVVAHDEDPAVVLGYAWTASCGSFDLPSSASATWTAPATDPATCQLTISVADGKGATASATLSVEVTSARTITGSRLVTHWPDPPSAQVTGPAPEVATAAAPFALTRDGSGAWTVHAGGHLQGDGTLASGFAADGSFSIPGVPGGAYLLCYLPPDGVQTCSAGTGDGIDLGYDVLGRADQAPATEPTPVTLALTGLDPWNPITDQVQLTSSNADVWDVAGAVGDFQGGDTGGTLVEDWANASGSGAPLDLLEPADVLYLHQLSTRSIYQGGTILFYAAATHATAQPPGAGSLTGLALADGQATTLSASLELLPLATAFDLDWDLPLFEGQLALLGPSARTTLPAEPHLFRVGASAFGLAYPVPAALGGAPEFVRFPLPAGLGTVAGTLYYGRFLPSLWSEWAEASFAAQVSYLGPGAVRPLLDRASVVRRDALPGTAGPLSPEIGAVLTPRIGGADALQDQAGVGVTPTVSWEPPSIGSPTAYLVEVVRLGTAGGATTASVVLRVLTAGTSLEVPPGTLQAGATYYARITAEASAAAYDSAPFRRAGAFARATVLTGTFTP